MKTQLMTHIVAGYPTLAASEKLAETMAEAGVSFLEIQIPFSDPVADGPVIAKANQKALENGTTVEDCFRLIARLSKKIAIPIYLMTYANIALQGGLEKFCKRERASGAEGLIIPDIPVDEEPYEHYLKLCKKHQLHAIQVISPMTTEARLKQIAKVAAGFIYCMSRTGITGERKKLAAHIDTYLATVRKHIDLPIALGFGISDLSHVKALNGKADILVMGSKITSMMGSGSPSDLRKISSFLKEILQYLYASS